MYNKVKRRTIKAKKALQFTSNVRPSTFYIVLEEAKTDKSDIDIEIVKCS